MRSKVWIGLVLIAFALVAATTISVVASADETEADFVAHLTGAEEVPAHSTLAQGQLVVTVSPDGTQGTFMLIAANIQNVFAAHIHCGDPGVNGPIVVPLFMGPLIAGRFNGVLASGSFTLTGKSCTFGTTTLSLLDAMMAGRTYSNIHTSQFPGGEIRGQIMPAD